MTTSFTYRAVSFTMAFLLFISTSGLTMDMHMCSGHLKRINVFGKAKTCQEKIEMKLACHKKSGSASLFESNCGSHQGCCQNDSFELDIDTDVTAPQIGSLNLDFIVGFISAFISSTDPLDWSSQLLSVQNHIPPLISQDYQILFQRYLL